MNLQIDFYGKEQVSVVIGFDASESCSEKQFLELLLFACFALRQFHNLGHNTAIDAFVGLLIWDRVATELMKDRPQIPPAVDLLVKAHFARLNEKELLFLDFLPALMAVETRVAHSRFESDPLVDVVQDDYLSKIPQIVDYRGNPGKKRFTAIMKFDKEKGFADFTLRPKGFGVLGRGANYYAPHSIVALIRFLTGKYSTDQTCLKRLSFIAESCSKAHMRNMISRWNQSILAIQIVMASEEIGQ